MRHNLTLDGIAFRLRPVDDSDAPLLLSLRNNPERNCFIHATSPHIGDQLAWLAEYYKRPNDYYFIVESMLDGKAEGLISIYNINDHDKNGEWGRWILRQESFGAVESAWLIYRCAFERLRLNEIYCRTVARNESVVSFHDSCGIKKRRFIPGFFELSGQQLDAIEHRVFLSDWPSIEPRLHQLANLVATRRCRV